MFPAPSLEDRLQAFEYCLKAQHYFATASTADTPTAGQQLLDIGMYWYRLAVEAGQAAMDWVSLV